MGDTVSEARDMYEDGYGCSCHITPPCSFCTSMDEEECEVRWADGMDGLVRLWESRDNQEEQDEPTTAEG